MNEERNSTTRADVATKLRGCSVAEWGTTWLARRLAEGQRSIPTERSRWKYISETPIGALPLEDVTAAVARGWMREFMLREISLRTKRYALNQIRQAFEGARELGLIASNPFADVRLPRWRPDRRVSSAPNPWTVLEPHEQTSLLNVIPEPDRWLVEFALGTGMRQGEQWSMRRRHLAGFERYAIAAFGGTDDRPTKGGSPRRVPLFGMALHAAQRQCDLLDGKVRFPSLPRWDADPSSYLWPAPNGGPREKKAPTQWRAWLDAAGIDRRVRWHDLRHTCAASLVSGWWGRAWSLEEVRELLGHSSITITERYAHFSRDLLGRAARETIAALAIHNAGAK